MATPSCNNPRRFPSRIEPLEVRRLLSTVSMPVPTAGVDYGPLLRQKID